MMNGSWIEPVLAIVGLAVITVVSRSFFMIPERELPLPGWLKRGLKYAPLAALTAVIAWGTLTEGGFLLDPKNPSILASYFIRGLIFFIFLCCSVNSFVN